MYDWQSVAAAAPPTKGGCPTVGQVETAWQAELAGAIDQPAELCRRLGLDDRVAAEAALAAAEYALRLPAALVGRIRPGDAADAVLAQFLPRRQELQPAAGFVRDPVGDAAAARSPGLLHKYRGRLLMVATGRCAVHCRYCFRRHLLRPAPPAVFEAAIAALAADSSIEELILSGGDPLTLDDAVLGRFARRVASVPHLGRLRIHSRMPVIVPSRVTNDLLEWLRGTRLTTFVVVQVNHPEELGDAARAALGRLVDAGVPVLNQAVLLRGVNDHLETQVALWRSLVDLRVMPYYLHQLDRVAGAAHFEVPLEEGLAMMAALRERLPGYAVPRYVRDEPGRGSKVPLCFPSEEW